jgi:thiol:disulfide interchange protein
MKKPNAQIAKSVFVLAFFLAQAANAADRQSQHRPESAKIDIVSISVQQQYEAIRPGQSSALAIRFALKENWHFYASAKTAPGQMNLKIRTDAEGLNFEQPGFPASEKYYDKATKANLEVFSGTFTVYVPFKTSTAEQQKIQRDVTIDIEGAVCSDVMCRLESFSLGTKVKIDPDAPMSEARFVLPARTEPEKTTAAEAPYSAPIALPLAFVAGLSLNIMPCVWPILPIIIMRLIGQSKENKKKAITLGLTFCLGILSFFAALAALNIILRLGYGTIFQWGDYFRYPAFIGGMALLMVVLALFMFGMFTVVVPSSISSKSGSGQGYLGAIGTGFLAAVLSTPCSFAILAAAFAWAQAQPLTLATVAIMVIGLGMALPYAILTSMPGLLKRLPKPGRWMELFKQAVGFILLGIAVWLITVLPQPRRADVLYFALVLSFCVWMWSGWVSYNTKLSHKMVIRLIAVVLVLLAGLMFLIETASSAAPINWQPYDADLIESAKARQHAVLIKFTADWCLSCNVVEKTVYSQQEIIRLIDQKNVLAIKADTTTKQLPATQALKNIYNEPGVPVSILLLPGREPVRWRGKAFADELKQLLEALPHIDSSGNLAPRLAD